MPTTPPTGQLLGQHCKQAAQRAVPALVFFGSMVTGMVLFKTLNPRADAKPAQPARASDEKAGVA